MARRFHQKSGWMSPAATHHRRVTRRISLPAVLRGALQVVGFGAILTLAGCDPNLPDTENFEMAVGLHRDVVVVVTCEDISVHSVRLSWRNRDDGVEDNSWMADGALELREGQELSSASPPEGLDVTSWKTFDLAAADRVGFYALRGSGQGIGVNVVVPADGVPEGSWLHSDGTVGDAPCD